MGILHKNCLFYPQDNDETWFGKYLQAQVNIMSG